MAPRMGWLPELGVWPLPPDAVAVGPGDGGADAGEVALEPPPDGADEVALEPPPDGADELV